MRILIAGLTGAGLTGTSIAAGICVEAGVGVLLHVLGQPGIPPTNVGLITSLVAFTGVISGALYAATQ